VFEDFVVAVCWHIFTAEDVYKVAQKVFAGLQRGMKFADFGGWVKKGESVIQALYPFSTIHKHAHPLPSTINHVRHPVVSS